MSRAEIASMLVLGGTAGILSGMFGIGGGLIIVPTLIVLFELDPKTAVGTSLFALLLPTGLLGVLEYWRRGELRLRPPDLRDFDLEPSPEFRPGRRSSRRVADWCPDT